MNDMTQTERIKQMEQRLERASQSVMRLSAALDDYAEAQKDIRELNDYYGSDTWKQDFADDEAGRLPADLKRGVLSEDAIWNLLSDHREVLKTMKSISKNHLLRFFLAVALLCSTACFGQEPANAPILTDTDSIPDGIFFRISGGGLAEPSYILGTIHTIPGDFVHSIPHFDEAASRVRQFVFESDLGHILRQTVSPLFQDSTILAAITARNDTLFRYENCDSLHNPYIDDMEPSTYDLVRRTLVNDFDMPDFYMHSVLRNSIRLQQQYFAAIRKLTAEMGVPLKRTDYPIDLYVADSVARPLGATIAELDTAFVFARPDSTITKFLADEANGLHDRKFYSNTFMVNNVYYYWLMLTATRTYCEHYFRYEGRVMAEPMKISKLEQKIFADRNALWIQRLPALLHQAPSIVVVGLGHLFDRGSTPGLLTSLKRLGYKVEALASPANPASSFTTSPPITSPQAAGTKAQEGSGLLQPPPTGGGSSTQMFLGFFDS